MPAIAEPMTIDEALYEMELIGHDFFLFVNKETAVRPLSTIVTAGLWRLRDRHPERGIKGHATWLDRSRS